MERILGKKKSKHFKANYKQECCASMISDMHIDRDLIWLLKRACSCNIGSVLTAVKCKGTKIHLDFVNSV